MSLAFRIIFLSLFLFVANCAADTVIGFEPPLPSGLAPMSFWEDTPVASQSRITNQYGNFGILMKNVVLVNLGSGQATSGTNGIAPISASGNIDYGSQVTFTFVDPQDNTSPATTDSFAISTDRWGGSGNTTTVSGYDINGNLLGSVSHLDTGGVTLQLQGIGKIHVVAVGSTLINHSSGGVALDDVQFGPVSSVTSGAGGSMAQVASGGGWQTTFTLVNTGTTSAQVELSFFDNSGNALSLPLFFVQSGTPITASTLTETISVGAMLVILTQGNNAATPVVGSSQLSTDGNVSGFAIFRYNPSGQEAVVPLETRNTTAYLLAFDNTNGVGTGVALANVSNQATNVPVVLRDDTGATLGMATINLPARGHTSFMLTSSYSSVAGKRGTVEFDTPAGTQITVLGLRATPSGTLTTIPVLAK